MLYRIQRNQTTGGWRALGRLAFVDNYRPIIRRLRSGLEASTDADGLARAARETGLGLQTNLPRVYVVTGLGGGTGAGMFIDLAYALREMLRQEGYAQAEVVGVLLLPAAGE